MVAGGHIVGNSLGSTLSEDAGLLLTNVSKRFGGVWAVSDVSIEVEPGTLTALIGPNGAGKTTLFNLITNVYSATEGSIVFLGHELTRLSISAIAKLGIVRTFQAARVFPGMTTIENVIIGGHLGASVHPVYHMLRLPKARQEELKLVEKAEALLELGELLSFRDQAATDLPIGAQKLVDLFRALLANPRMLLLDEPAAGLNDTETLKLATLLRAICQTGITVVVVEHNMSLVMSIADNIIVLDAGKIIAVGSPSEIKVNQLVINAYLGGSEGGSL